MTSCINRAIELLAQDQAIYYDGPHSGHVLTHAQGRDDAGTWADYINVGMEHGAFDMTGLAEYMRGLVDGGPARSGHRTPAIIVEAPVNGTDEANVRFNAWQFRQILGRGVHGILLCQAETADAVRAFIEVLPLSAPCSRRGSGDSLAGRAHARDPAAGTRRRRQAGYRHARARFGGDRRADLGHIPTGVYAALRPLAAEPRGRTAAGRQAGKPRGYRELRRDLRGARALALPRWDLAISACRSATPRCSAIPIRRRWPRRGNVCSRRAVAIGIAFLEGCSPANIVARLDEGVRVIAGHKRRRHASAAHIRSA